MPPRSAPLSGIGAAAGLLFLGLLTGLAWLYTTDPQSATDLLQQLTVHRLGLLMLLGVAGLILVALLSQAVQAFVQFLFQAAKVAVVVIALAGGLYGWQQVSAPPERAAATSFTMWKDEDRTPAPEDRPAVLSSEIPPVQDDSDRPWWGTR